MLIRCLRLCKGLNQMITHWLNDLHKWIIKVDKLIKVKFISNVTKVKNSKRLSLIYNQDLQIN